MSTRNSSSIYVESFEGTPDGVNLAIPQQELRGTEARYIQDGLLDLPGITRRRGPVTEIANLASLSELGCGFASVLNPIGQIIIAVLTGTASTGKFSPYSTDYTSKVDITWPFFLPSAPPTTPFSIVDTKSSAGGGVWIGVSKSYDSNTSDQALAYWYGGNKATYTTGTVSLTAGSKTVSGSSTVWNTNASSGMFLFANTDDPYTGPYIGVIEKVNSNTSMTLMTPSPYTSTAKTYTLQSLRGFCPRVTKGVITCDVASVNVLGGQTKFKSQGLDSGIWNIYRASDFKFIGKVATVVNDSGITLAANATVAASNEKYIAVKVDGNFSLLTNAVDSKVGFLNAVYAERQWYANKGTQTNNTTMVWFSESAQPEDVDLSTFDGDFIDASSTAGINLPIKAIAPAYNGLVVLKENEASIISGTTPLTFTRKKVLDDGTLDVGSVQSYNGGVIWAGKEAIYLYDGVQLINLTESKLGTYYKDSIRTFDPTKYRMYSMMVRDHYMLFIEKLTPTVGVIKGNVSMTPNKYTICINMLSKAFTFFTNLFVRGSITLPAYLGHKTWYLINNFEKGKICDTDSLFESDGPDSFGADGGAPGPDFYFESKKYNASQPLRKKMFKQLAINYQSQGNSLTLDTMVGLNDASETSSTDFPETAYTWNTLAKSVSTWSDLETVFATWNAINISTFLPKRVKFYRRNQYIAFRIYQTQGGTYTWQTLGRSFNTWNALVGTGEARVTVELPAGPFHTWEQLSPSGKVTNKVVLGPFELQHKLQRLGRL